MSSTTATMPLHNYEVPSVTLGDNNDATNNQNNNSGGGGSDEYECTTTRAEDANDNAVTITKTRIPIPRSEPEIDYGGLALVFLAPALGGFLYGYDIGATSFVLSMMRADRDYEHWWHNFSKIQQGLYVSCLAFGALIGSHIVLTCLATSIGRRKEIRIAATLYIVGAMLNVMSGTILATTGVFQWPPRWYAKNGDGSDEYYSYEYTSIGFGWGFTSLMFGRLFYGAGVGFIMHGAPTYMAEMSPSHVRGAVVSAKETVIVFGIVVGMLMGDLQSDYPANWTGK
jgi:MFS family permease